MQDCVEFWFVKSLVSCKPENYSVTTEITHCTHKLRFHVLAGKGDGDVSENDFVDKIMHRLKGHGSSLTTTVKNDADWEPFKSSPFSQKVFLVKK